MEFELWVYVALFLVAVLAGGIDAIAGGGGLLVLPALLLAGVPPVTALGTNKFQGLFGTGSASYTFWKAGHLDLRRWGPIAILAGLASVVGAYAASVLPTDALNIVVPILLVALAIYFAIKPDFGGRKTALLPISLITFALVPLVGFYDGIFGPGAGSFYMAVLAGLGGASAIAATGQTKILNFASNVGGFILFAAIGAVVWKLGALMAVGQFIGAKIGAGLAIKNGEKIIRPLLVVMSLMMAARLFFL